ncbi:MAG: helix-turn-helix transcriptional regulator [Acidimicrobiales bacterium]
MDQQREDHPREPRLELFKVLGDNTRYAIYLELARSPRPLATAEIAATLGLHANTVRPQLEKMREVGLLDVEVDGRGGVGRPQHRYALAADAPSLGLEPALFPLATKVLLRVAAAAGLGAAEAIDAARELALSQPDHSAAARTSRSCVDQVSHQLAELGFDPAIVSTVPGAVTSSGSTATEVTLMFGHCPFRELAEANPALICGLHQGLVEAMVVGSRSGAGSRFRSLIDRDPCQVDLLLDPAV